MHMYWSCGGINHVVTLVTYNVTTSSGYTVTAIRHLTIYAFRRTT